MLEDQHVEITKQPSVGIFELKKELSALLQLGKGPLAQQLLLKEYGSRLLKKIDGFLPSCSIYKETYSWAEWEIESFIRLVKENAPSSETVTALHAASICVQASFNHYSILESQGLKLSKLLMVLLQPYDEEFLEMNFRRARSMLLNFEGNDDILSPQIVFAPLGLTASSSDSMLTGSGTRFIFLVKDTIQQLTLEVISHFGATALTKISHFFDEYMEILIKALPGPSEDENLTENKDYVYYKAETDSQ
ncbi:hypothetical protein GIB67_033969 [Kingdonia uniflora]|uniref:Uncharacterized protein n=1 Tax=Kingdonia uniflora TaxID=39325 RepID=A0A7J7M634_9MAGN|nr:hypothetical protein GIB67_033969 [Kingdonia uniflora]